MKNANQIPVEFLIVRKEFLTALLKKMPVVRLGSRKDKPVLRVYFGDKRRYHEVTRSSKKWREAMMLYDKRIKIERSLRLTKHLLSNTSICNKCFSLSTTNLDNDYDVDFYDNLIDSSCTFEKNTKYYYNGHNFRSRSEMQFATILDEFGLEYKYDVKIRYGNHEHTVDFAIVFREFNRCIFIEYFGRCDDPEYNEDNTRKLLHSQNSNIYIGRDLFIMSGDRYYTPGSDVVRIQVAAIIAQLACIHIKETGPAMKGISALVS